MFWGIYYIEAGQGVKFNNEMSWDTGDNFGAENEEPKGYGEYPAGGANLVISTSGYYQIVVICTLSADKKSINRKIVLSEPEPYLIGDAAAGGPAESGQPRNFDRHHAGARLQPRKV